MHVRLKNLINDVKQPILGLRAQQVGSTFHDVAVRNVSNITIVMG